MEEVKLCGLATPADCALQQDWYLTTENQQELTFAKLSGKKAWKEKKGKNLVQYHINNVISTKREGAFQAEALMSEDSLKSLQAWWRFKAVFWDMDSLDQAFSLYLFSNEDGLFDDL